VSGIAVKGHLFPEFHPENLAIQRSQQLSAVLSFALALGTTDPMTNELLKV
jgi:hypothetical protein